MALMSTLVRNGKCGIVAMFKRFILNSELLGHGAGIVVATGKDTEFGSVFALMGEVVFFLRIVFTVCMQQLKL